MIGCCLKDLFCCNCRCNCDRRNDRGGCERNDDDRCFGPSERVCRERFIKETRVSTRWHREGCNCHKENKDCDDNDDKFDHCNCEGRN